MGAHAAPVRASYEGGVRSVTEVFMSAAEFDADPARAIDLAREHEVVTVVGETGEICLRVSFPRVDDSED
jgi:hypothetical protein